MKKLLLRIALALVLTLVALLGYALYSSQRAELFWSPALAEPHFRAQHPRVAIDAAHHNASRAGFGQRYEPFASLLRADGYAVEDARAPFSAASLAGVQVLVCANPSGAAKPQLFGINLLGGSDGDRAAPAFAPEEIAALRAWIEQGGALLLIADHAPFGAASQALASALGVAMHQGFVEVPGELSDPLLFARSNERLGAHAINDGDGARTRIERVQTFTGQSLDGPAGAVELLRLPANAIEYLPQGREGEGLPMKEEPAGRAQGLAFELGRGRVVVLGEAAMLTAQVFEGERFGMDRAQNDNQQFALNVLHWLSREL